MPTRNPLEMRLGAAVRRARLDAELDQITLAQAAGVGDKALRRLESGQGATVATLVAVVGTLGLADWLDELAPEASVDPLAVARQMRAAAKRPKRAPRREG